MTRQDYIKKWFSYGVTLVLVAVLQGLVFTRLRVFGLIPMLLPLALVALATLEGPVSGAGFGIAVGIVSMYVDGGSAWVIVLACIGGLAVGLIARYVLRQDFIGHLICSVGLLILRMVWCVIPRWIDGVAELPVLLRVGIGELLWTLVFPSADEYNHVSRVVLAALGLGPAIEVEDDDDKEIADAKN